MGSEDIDAGKSDEAEVKSAETSLKRPAPDDTDEKSSAKKQDRKSAKGGPPRLSPFDPSPLVPCIVFGLGNPESQSMTQRHNLGVRVVEALANSLKCAKPYEGEAAEGTNMPSGIRSLTCFKRQCLLMPPQGFMNSSGPALRDAIKALGLIPVGQFSSSGSDGSQKYATPFLVVTDDCALPFGSIRLRVSGTSAGHTGLKSFEEIWGPDYHRLRIGIGGGRGVDRKDHVLGDFTAEEEQKLPEVLARAARACAMWVALGGAGVQQTMCSVNGAGSKPSEKPADELIPITKGELEARISDPST